MGLVLVAFVALYRARGFHSASNMSASGMSGGGGRDGGVSKAKRGMTFYRARDLRTGTGTILNTGEKKAQAEIEMQEIKMPHENAPIHERDAAPILQASSPTSTSASAGEAFLP